MARENNKKKKKKGKGVGGERGGVVFFFFLQRVLSLIPQQAADAANTKYFCYAYVRFRRTGIGFAGNGTGDLFSHQ